jgi:hypothetical protein
MNLTLKKEISRFQISHLLRKLILKGKYMKKKKSLFRE